MGSPHIIYIVIQELEELRRGLSNLLDIRIKSILAFKICKLTSLQYFELKNRSVMATKAST